MQGGGQLQGAEVPPPRAEGVVELVDVAAPPDGLEGDDAHLGVPHDLQAWDGSDALPQLVCCLQVEQHT